MVEGCVRGFYVYQDIWIPTIRECLSCQTEDSSAFDLYAVANRKSANVIGHVPRKISAACSISILRGGTLTCIIINFRRRYSRCDVNTDDNNNYYMKIILAKFKFGGLVMIRQFTKFSFSPKFVVIWYLIPEDITGGF